MAVLSGVGNDELGNLALDFVESMNVSGEYVNVLEKVQTGTAVVTIKNGEPEYELVENVGYDNIVLNDEQIENIRNEKIDVFYFGTLAQRNSVSRDTLHKLLNENLFKTIFVDVNLRQNYYDKEMLKFCLEKADIIKINRSEAKVLSDFCLVEALDDKEMCESLCEKI